MTRVHPLPYEETAFAPAVLDDGALTECVVQISTQVYFVLQIFSVQQMFADVLLVVVRVRHAMLL
ncbi:hypothetical protein PTE30175_02029 [Pandoraea terrae]|uniref:Uncharacterized protein n=1 Tax=Pandoraea terrae TaxID=1537710 RepID=A0A5E4UKD9_9BURK|nr:hypothetical protein [Pandoraea terrae]VVE00458.1 hypothetical protein PTE30175_02029 [Pandoraea terrae]